MQNNTPDDHNNKSKPRRIRPGVTRITLTITDGLLERVDKAAEQDYMSRSDIIRIALLWYLRPQGQDLDQVDPKLIFETLKRRQTNANMRKMMKDLGML